MTSDGAVCTYEVMGYMRPWANVCYDIRSEDLIVNEYGNVNMGGHRVDILCLVLP